MPFPLSSRTSPSLSPRIDVLKTPRMERGERSNSLSNGFLSPPSHSDQGSILLALHQAEQTASSYDSYGFPERRGSMSPLYISPALHSVSVPPIVTADHDQISRRRGSLSSSISSSGSQGSNSSSFFQNRRLLGSTSLPPLTSPAVTQSQFTATRSQTTPPSSSSQLVSKFHIGTPP